MFKHLLPGLLLSAAMASFAAHAEAARMPLAPLAWPIDGKPILGTYAGGHDKLQDLEAVDEIGMNVVLGGHEELDTETPVGRYCHENGIKVLHHLTQFLYHGVKLREEISADQTTIPLYFQSGQPKQTSQLIQIDDELIRYESLGAEGLTGCQRGWAGTTPAPHREGVILFWPEAAEAEIASVKDSPNLYGYYTLDDSPGDAVSALRGLYQAIQKIDPGRKHPVCAGFGDAGSVVNLEPGVCDIMAIYWYPVSSRQYHRESTSAEVQHILAAARARVPGIPFFGIYQAFNGVPSSTGQGVPTAEQLREQLEDFVRDGASGLIAFWAGGNNLPGWTDLPELKDTLQQVHNEILTEGGLTVRPETAEMAARRIQPAGVWESPRPVPGVVPAWYSIGPFDDAAGAGIAAEFPPDTTFDVQAAYPTKFGTSRWRVRKTTAGVFGIGNLYGDGRRVTNCVQYVYCEITSPVEQEVQMRLCTDDDARIRLNGRDVYNFTGTRGLDYDKEVIPVTLPAGVSRLEGKIYNRGGMWGILLRFTDQQGNPVENLTFSPSGN